MAAYKLLPSSLREADSVRRRWAAVVDDGTTIEDLQRPEFWCHVANKLRQMDMIDILVEDSSYFAELIVLKSGVGFAKVLLLRHVELEAASPEDEDLPVVAKWKGPLRKHAVIRKTDGMILRDGFATKGEAETFAREYVQTVAA